MSPKHNVESSTLSGAATKQCCTCQLDLALTCFCKNKRHKDGLASKCRKCTSAYAKRHYEHNKPYYVKKAVKAKDKVRDALREAKNVPCADCNGRFHYSAMDFDHLPGSEKLFTLARAYASKEKLQQELAKCEVVCANCHRLRTWRRNFPLS